MTQREREINMDIQKVAARLRKCTNTEEYIALKNLITILKG